MRCLFSLASTLCAPILETLALHKTPATRAPQQQLRTSARTTSIAFRLTRRAAQSRRAGPREATRRLCARRTISTTTRICSTSTGTCRRAATHRRAACRSAFPANELSRPRCRTFLRLPCHDRALLLSIASRGVPVRMQRRIEVATPRRTSFW